MRSITSKFTLFLIIFTLLTYNLIAGDNQEDLKATIESINAKLNKAMLEGDFETMLAYHIDDVVCMPNYTEMIKGKKALKKYMEEDRKSGIKFSSFSSTIMDIWSCGDLVYEMGTYGMSIIIPDMSRPFADKGKYFTVWQKQSDGSYKVKFTIWNTDEYPLTK